MAVSHGLISNVMNPLDQAVFDIINGSHLMTDAAYQWVHPYELSGIMENAPREVFPLISSYTRTVGFDETNTYADLVVDIIYPVPEQFICDSPLFVSSALSTFKAAYDLDLYEIAMWITGRRKFPDGKYFYCYNVRGEATIQMYFGIGNDNSEAKDIRKLLHRDDILVQQLILPLSGPMDKICKPVFTPKPPEECCDC